MCHRAGLRAASKSIIQIQALGVLVARLLRRACRSFGASTALVAEQHALLSGKPAHDCDFAREGGLDAVGARAVTSRCATKERACVDGPQNQCGEDRCSRRAACDLMLLRVRLRELAVLPSPPPTVAAIGNRWPPSRCSCAFVLDMRRPSRRTRRRRAAGLDLVRSRNVVADGVEGVGLRPGRWLLVLGASGGLSV